MSLDDDRLDQLLNAPLTGVADDGFTLRLMRRVQAHHLRWQSLLWGLILAGLLPVLIALPLGHFLADWSVRLANTAARGAPILSYAAAALALLWVWKPRFFTR